MQCSLIFGAEAELPRTGEYQGPVSGSNRKIDVEAILRGHHVREGSHRLLCGRCVDDNIDLCVTVRKALFEAESVLCGLCDGHDDALDVAARSGLNVACARKMRTGKVVGP